MVWWFLDPSYIRFGYLVLFSFNLTSKKLFQCNIPILLIENSIIIIQQFRTLTVIHKLKIHSPNILFFNHRFTPRWSIKNMQDISPGVRHMECCYLLQLLIRYCIRMHLCSNGCNNCTIIIRRTRTLKLRTNVK